MQKEIEAILLEFDALWGGADASSNKQESWRKELAARIVKAAEQSMHPTHESLAQNVSSKSKRSVKPARG
jgi:hypothetical protein